MTPEALVDQAARERAVDPRRNVVLEASAGTGKTRVLVQRFLNLLRANVEPRNILAMTFTRKAAAEMRQRIVEELRSAAARSPADAARWRTLREHLGEIAISTIDAFCLSLLREFPLEADLDPGFEIADETEVPRLLEEALDRTLRACRALALEDPGVALALATLGERRVRKALEHLLERRLVAPRMLRRFLAASPRDLTAERACHRALARVRAVLESVPGGLEPLLENGPVRHPRFAMLARDLGAWRPEAALSAAASRSVLERLRDHFLKEGHESRKRPSPYKAEHHTSSEAHRRYGVAFREVAPAVGSVFDRLGRDLDVVCARGVWRMFAVASKQYRLVLDARALLDFPELLGRALALLEQMDEFAQSRYRLESRYHHVLVDEFQDTSRAQWKLMELLVRSWGEGQGLVADAPLPPSIFIVGDRKQSIYQFRDAEVTLFDEARRYVRGLRADGDVLGVISTSFRAVPGLLTFVNDVFDDVPKADGRDDRFRFEQPDRFPVGPDTGAAPDDDVLGMTACDRIEECAAAVAHEIARLLAEGSVRDRQTGAARAIQPGDIGILFRSRESHREFELAFEARSIPSYVYRGLGFFDADEVKDVLALLAFLAEPYSDLRAAAFARSRFVRLSDEALQHLAPRLAAAMAGGEPPPALPLLDDEDRRVLAQVRASLPAWLDLADRVPPAELLDLVLDETAYGFELQGPRLRQARENLKKLRSLIRRIQNRGYRTLGRVVDQLVRFSAGEEGNAVVDAVDAVSLMTVHAAKGLEFPVVFVVDLLRGAGGPASPVRVMSTPSGEPSVTIEASSEAGDEVAVRDEEETKRLLYVALTRARDRLYLVSVLDQGRARARRGSLGQVLPESLLQAIERAGCETGCVGWASARGAMHRVRVCRPPGDVVEAVAATAAESGDSRRHDFDPLPVRETPRIAVTALLGSVPASVVEPEEPRPALVGALVHRLFQWNGPRAQTVDRTRLAAVARRLIESNEAGAGDSPALIETAVDVYLAACQRPDVVAVLGQGERLFEVPFSLRLETKGGTAVVRGAIDCLVQHSDARVTVVELKTGLRRPEHERQLDLYVAAARELFRDRRVSGTLIYC